MVLRISSGTSMIMLMSLPVTNASFCPVCQLPLRLFRSLRWLKDDQRADLLYNSRPFLPLAVLPYEVRYQAIPGNHHQIHECAQAHDQNPAAEPEIGRASCR